MPGWIYAATVLKVFHWIMCVSENSITYDLYLYVPSAFIGQIVLYYKKSYFFSRENEQAVLTPPMLSETGAISHAASQKL